jgi:acetylcholinesterase
MYKSKPLFRAGIMNSGSVLPADSIDCPKARTVYDTVVRNAGCANTRNSLACLRSLPYEQYLATANSVPPSTSHQSLTESYLARPDGHTLTVSAEVLLHQGNGPQFPSLSGTKKTKELFFAILRSNITTIFQLVDYLNNYYYPRAPRSKIEELVETYPDDPIAGFPFRRGTPNEVYPQYKRLAAMLGDLFFTLTRLTFLTLASQYAPHVPTWSCLDSYDYGLPVVGIFHSSDISPAYGLTPGFPSTSIQSYYLSFVNTMDPNQGTSSNLTHWPCWNNGKQLLNFGVTEYDLEDAFREQSGDSITKNATVLLLEIR